jgi:hypothetical protein
MACTPDKVTCKVTAVTALAVTCCRRATVLYPRQAGLEACISVVTDRIDTLFDIETPEKLIGLFVCQHLRSVQTAALILYSAAL